MDIKDTMEEATKNSKVWAVVLTAIGSTLFFVLVVSLTNRDTIRDNTPIIIESKKQIDVLVQSQKEASDARHVASLQITSLAGSVKAVVQNHALINDEQDDEIERLRRR